jgi:DtxR family Mn-dependent transcriptional regulator
MEWHPAFEEYCEAIFELAEDDVEVIQARIADRIGVSRPSVSEMIKRMDVEGLVDVKRGRVRLTAKGRRLAEQVVRRHRLAERFLTDVLLLSWTEAHQEAGKWEHIISDRVETAINLILGDPTTCPHGNPIPGSNYETPDHLPLSAMPVGEAFMITRIPEELEFTPGLLAYLEGAALTPGSTGTVTASSPDGTLTVRVEDRHIGVGAFASQRILVLPGATR